MKEIIDSSHKVVIITGDNPLTACHVAKVLRFTRKLPILVLDEPAGKAFSMFVFIFRVHCFHFPFTYWYCFRV